MKQINEYINQSVNEFSGNAFSEKVKYTTDYEIAQTVIVGSVPSTYADIVR